MYEKVVKNIESIANSSKIENLAVNSLSEIKPNKKSAIQYIISMLIALLLSYVITYKGETVIIMLDAVELINSTSLAMIAIIFGTYAIFQALMTDTVMWALLTSSNNLLRISNESFLHLVFLYLVEIVVNIVLIILLKVIPIEFCLFTNLVYTNLLAFILCLCYFSYCFLLFYEMKNFAVNIYQMFNVYNVYKAIDLMNEKTDVENTCEDE